MLIDKRYISVKFNEEQLRERNKPLSLLLDLSGFLAASRDLGEVLQNALSKVLEWLDLKAGRIYLMDESERFLSLAACQGVEAEGFERVKITEGFSGKAARTRSFIAQYVSELEDEKRAALLSKKGFKVIVCVPLLAMGKVVGVMNLAADRMIEIDQDKIDLLIAIGSQLAIAANNARLYGDISRKVTELKAQKDAIEFLAYSISHDLKSPAVGIYGLTRRLLQHYCEGLNDTGKRYCGQILKAAEQIVGLVDRINTYIMTKEAPLHFEPVNIRDVTSMIRSEFAEALASRKVSWVEVEALPTILGDKMALTRLFRNLIDNALKYGGLDLHEIKIDWSDDAESYVFMVSDDGVALKEEDAERLFKLFHRHESSRGIEGTGLGLAIIREIAERHRGKVWLKPGAQKGTTFCVSISKELRAEPAAP